jgi:PufQ cytochrome subunit
MAFTTHDGQGSARRRAGAEYRVYFACIYLICLPFAALRWVLGLARSESGNPGAHRRALGEARAITPMIFWA